MRLHRFYVEEEIRVGEKFTVYSSELVNQISRVFRLKSGDSVIVFNGTGFDYVCKIDKFGERNKIKGDNSIVFIATSVSRSNFISKNDLYLCSAVLKRDKFEFVVEKATELGVAGVFPIQAERSEKKSLNEKRLNKIAIEASEQSGRGDIPTINKIMGLGDAVELLKRQGVDILAFHTEGEHFSVGSFGGKSKKQSLAIFIGPEGGWSPDEIDLFHRNSIPIFCLGSQVLRAETAVITTLALLVFGY
jgi:16S rRNA (uracil1498-N3)-methyltransferase